MKRRHSRSSDGSSGISSGSVSVASSVCDGNQNDTSVSMPSETQLPKEETLRLRNEHLGYFSNTISKLVKRCHVWKVSRFSKIIVSSLCLKVAHRPVFSRKPIENNSSRTAIHVRRRGQSIFGLY